jgi:hypothetical protein
MVHNPFSVLCRSPFNKVRSALTPFRVFTVYTLLACVFFLVPDKAFGQLEALRWVDLPPVGSIVEFEDFDQISSIKEVKKLSISNVREETVNRVDYVWLEIESEMYDPKVSEDRVPVISRFAIPKNELREGKKFLEVVRDLVVQVDGKAPFRIPDAMKAEMLKKGYLSGGLAGPGNMVDWTFEDTGEDEVEVPAGLFRCCRMLGKGKVRMVFTNGESWIDAYALIWTNSEVPFGVVKMILQFSGKGPDSPDTTNLVDAKETFTLQSYGRGAQTKIRPRKKGQGPTAAPSD